MAFAVPIIQKWAQDPFGIFALVLTPTRYDQFAQVDGFHSNKLVFTNTSPLKTTESWLFRFSSSSRPSLRHRA
jgi:hypothetical protein